MTESQEIRKKLEKLLDQLVAEKNTAKRRRLAAEVRILVKPFLSPVGGELDTATGILVLSRLSRLELEVETLGKMVKDILRGGRREEGRQEGEEPLVPNVYLDKVTDQDLQFISLTHHEAKLPKQYQVKVYLKGKPELQQRLGRIQREYLSDSGSDPETEILGSSFEELVQRYLDLERGASDD